MLAMYIIDYKSDRRYHRHFFLFRVVLSLGIHDDVQLCDGMEGKNEDRNALKLKVCNASGPYCDTRTDSSITGDVYYA